METKKGKLMRKVFAALAILLGVGLAVALLGVLFTASGYLGVYFWEAMQGKACQTTDPWGYASCNNDDVTMVALAVAVFFLSAYTLSQLVKVLAEQSDEEYDDEEDEEEPEQSTSGTKPPAMPYPDALGGRKDT